MYFETRRHKSQYDKQTHLHQCSLNLSVGRGALREASAADRVNLVHENDAGLVVSRIRKHFSDHASALADVFVHNGA